MATTQNVTRVLKRRSAPPKNSFLKSLHNAMKFEWRVVLGELIDNSLDAGAKNVNLVFKQDYCSITDDGCGMADVVESIQYGNHCAHETEGSGRYGVGLKDAALMLWGRTRITSARDGVVSVVEEDWESRSERSDWDYDYEDDVHDGAPFTKIEFLDTSSTLSSRQFDPLVEYLEWMFSNRPKGTVVTLRGMKKKATLGEFSHPQLTDEIRQQIVINGKSADLHVGILEPGQRFRFCGLTYRLAHRSLCRSAHGLGEFSDRNIYGTVQLSQDWNVSKHKDQVVDDDFDALGEEIERVVEPLLRKAESQAEFVESAAFDREVQSLLTQALQQGVRERRDKGDTNGTAEPKNTGRTRTPQKTQPSRLVKKILQGKLRYQWEPDDQPINESGDLSAGRYDEVGCRIYLNELVPLWAKMRRERNVDGVVAAALVVLTSNHREAQKTLNFKENGAIEMVSRILANMQVGGDQ